MLQIRSTSATGQMQGTPARTRSASPLLDHVRLTGTCMRFSRDTEIFGEEEPADYVYTVLAGAVRLSTIMSDGRRQIAAFYLPGDVFGLDADATHSFAAEAISDTEVALVKRTTLFADAQRDTALGEQLWAVAMRHVQQAQAHMLLLGRKNAQERIATFLMDMAQRLDSSACIELPMSRLDIADYLGLTIETVSRTLTQLERDKVIAIPVSRRILVRDTAMLNVLNDRWAA